MMDRHQHFSRFERGGHDVDEEILRRNAPAALRARQLQFSLQRDDDRRPVGGGIGIGQRAADRAAIAHLRIGDQAGGLMEDRQHLSQRLGRQQFGMRRQGADPDAVADLDSLQFIDAP